MANFFARLANAVLIRLHVLYDMVMGESTLRDLKDPTLFLKQCKHMAEHELDVFLGSDLLKCFAREHEEETDKYVVELFVAEGDTNGRGAKPRRYFLDLTSRKIKIECGIYTIDSSAIEAAEDYADQGRDVLISVKFVIVLAKMLINNQPCYVSAQRQ